MHLTLRHGRYEKWTVLAAAAITYGVVLAPGVSAANPAPTANVLLLQSAIVAARFQAAVGAAQKAFSAASRALTSAQNTQLVDQRLADQAAQIETSDTARVAADSRDVAADTAARQAAAVAVTADRERLKAIAVELYVGPPAAPGADTSIDPSAADQATFATIVATLGGTLVGRQLLQDVAAGDAATRAVERDTKALAAEQATVADVQRVQSQRTSVLAIDAAAVANAGRQVQTAQANVATAQATLTAKLAALANPPGTPNDGSPSIVGPAALTATQLVAWYHQQGYTDVTSTPIAQLAGWYISEGAAENVRGDVAFAQAVVETGGFSSPDAVGLNNYAGIGHCDSCPTGIPFGSPQLGVRAQVQLLHSFANASLTASQLAAPLADPAINPQSQADRGCCPTWQSLTGKWATDPGYGETILSVYDNMLTFTLSHIAA